MSYFEKALETEAQRWDDLPSISRKPAYFIEQGARWARNWLSNYGQVAIRFKELDAINLKLQTENAKLRGALEECKAGDFAFTIAGPVNPLAEQKVWDTSRIAEQALKETGGGDE